MFHKSNRVTHSLKLCEQFFLYQNSRVLSAACFLSGQRVSLNGHCHFRCVRCNPAQSLGIYVELRRDASPKISLERVLHKVQVVKPVNICARLREPMSRFNCWEFAAGIQP